MRNAGFIIALLVVLSVSATAAALPPPVAAAVGDDGTTQTQIDAERSFADAPTTEIHVRLKEDLDAQWTITVNYTVETQNETAAFERFVEAFEAGETTTGLGVAPFETAAVQASAQTDRQMEIRNVSRTGNVENGTLTLSFVWTNFVEQTPSGELRLGDVFSTTTGNTWVSSLERGQTLVIETPEGYDIRTTAYPQQNNSVVVEGPAEFDDQEPLVVTYQEIQNRPPPPFQLPWTVLVGVLGVLAALVMAAAFLRRRSAPALTNGGDPTKSESPPPPAASVTPEPSEEADEEADDGVDLSLLSDEERVEYLLEQGGGRMKQANIVRETGWSDAKVSQLLSAMAEEGRVNKLRLGRENLISLPDSDEE
ncbi:MAG: helix-turn-helix transcriptional regulator [Halobacteriota archaeon]